MPQSFHNLCQRAATAAGYPDFQPDACLINRYAHGAKLSLHQDKDEPDLRAPIVSVSLGLPAIFQFGGLKRNDRSNVCCWNMAMWWYGAVNRGCFITVFNR